MISLATTVRGLLESTGATVWYFYPRSWIRLPAISWRESGNRELAQADGREHLAALTYSVDVWAAGPAEAAELAAKVDAAMSGMRFRRDYAEDLFESGTGIFHRSMRYRCVADMEGRIYQ